MNGYSKIKFIGNSNTKSRSMDFADLLTFPKTPKPISTTASSKTQFPSPQQTNQDLSSLDQEEGFNGTGHESFGVRLSRNSSVSSAYALHHYSAIKRAFSLRRSSSVSERYCRILDQSVTLVSPFDDEEVLDTMEKTTRSVKEKKKHSRGKILKACKRLFGL